jgi:hopene-associated glycosyltransferase HpnB
MSSHFRFDPAGLVGVIVLAIWLHLFFGRAWFWRVGRQDADQDTSDGLSAWPSVTAIVPARNEAETVGQALSSLLRQDYPGTLSIVLVDDHSEDRTAAIAQEVAKKNGVTERMQIITGEELPSGWTGKLWAMQTGVASSEAGKSQFLWFTDADVTHAPDTLRRLVVRAERDQLDLASLMVMLHASTLPERLLIPPFLYFFLMLYPPKWIADADLITAGAAGGCILLKRDALRRSGGLAAIRGEVIDDCALARAIKTNGGRVWMGLTRRSVSLRAYETFAEICNLIARTAFTQLRYSSALLLGTLVGMLLTYLAPVLLLFLHDATARVLGAAGWLLMTLSFAATVRFYRISILWSSTLPFAALFYTAATWISAVRYWTGRGGQWKGRAQARREV